MTESSRRTETSGRSNVRTSKERKGRSRRNDRTRRREATHSGERTDARRHSVERLHRQYGNQAVQELASRQETETGARRPGDDRRIDRVADVVDGRAGRPLPADTRRVMGRRFGHDFRSVRVYDDAEAANSARLLGAAAYTVSSDIVFGTGNFAPNTMAGQLLLAHELAHVVQREQFDTDTNETHTVSVPGATFEREADTVAVQVVAGESVSVRASPNAVFALAEESWLEEMGEIFGPAVGRTRLTERLFTGMSQQWGGGTPWSASTGAGLNLLTAIPGLIMSGEKVLDPDSTGEFVQGLLGTYASGTGTISGGATLLSELGVGGASAFTAPALSTSVGTAFGSAGSGLLSGGAVVGAGLGGYAVGRAYDNLVGGAMNLSGAGDLIDEARGIRRPEGQHGDYSISGMLGGIASTADLAQTELLGDDSEPAYKQTVGWWLADTFGL